MKSIHPMKLALAFCTLLVGGLLAVSPAQAQYEAAYGGVHLDKAYDVATSTMFPGTGIIVGGTHSYGTRLNSSPPHVYVTYSGGPGPLGHVFDLQCWDDDAAIVELPDCSYVWTTGIWNAATGSYDIGVVRAVPTGAIMWAVVFGGHGRDGGTGIIQLSTGELMVSGIISEDNECSNGFLALLDPATGAPLWANSYHAPGAISGNDELWGLQEDIFGTFGMPTVYAVGSSNALGRGDDMWLLNVDIATGGVINVSNLYGGAANDKARELFLVHDPVINGDVVTMVGETYSFGAVNNNVFVQRLTPGGAPIWQSHYEIAGAGWDAGWDIDHSINWGAGDVIITGYTENTSDPRGNGFLMELDGSGGVLPSSTYTYGGTDHENLRAITLQAPGAPLTGYIAAGTQYSMAAAGAGCGDYYQVGTDILLFSGNGAFGNPCNHARTPAKYNVQDIQNVQAKVRSIQHAFINTSIETGVTVVNICSSTIGPVLGPDGNENPEGEVEGHQDETSDKIGFINANEINIAPNPVRQGETIKLAYTVQEEVEAIITVNDAMGRAVYETTGLVNSGNQSLSIPTAEWAKGSYTVTMQLGQELQTLKVIVTD